jgi:Na+-driven multidrug efflux pump
VREAIHGSRQDFTEGSISRAILLLAIPMVLEMVMESLFAVVDIFWVAHLGSDAITAVGLTESMLAPVFSIMGISMSTTAMVAHIGEDRRGAAVAAVQAVRSASGVRVGRHRQRHLCAAPACPDGRIPDVIVKSASLSSIVLGGSICILMLFLNNAIFRGAGDPAIAMRVLWLSNLINLVLDPCFIFGLGFFPRLGVAGAAVATTTGRGIGVLYQFWILFRGSGRVRLVSKCSLQWFQPIATSTLQKRRKRVRAAVNRGQWSRPGRQRSPPNVGSPAVRRHGAPPPAPGFDRSAPGRDRSPAWALRPGNTAMIPPPNPRCRGALLRVE